MKVLVLTAHPDLKTSQINRRWFDALRRSDNVVARDLTAVAGANMGFNIEEEQRLLLENDRVAFQFPFYWYSAPAVLKAWMDQVLNLGFAYGPGGDQLKGREFLMLVSTGGPAESYRAGGYNKYTMDELLRPFQQMADMAGMTYLSPYVFHGMVSATEAEMEASVREAVSYTVNPDLDPSLKRERLLLEMAS